ncbi:Vacuolar protein sorting-associated protein atg6 [Vermiconidia calcicola]|uniref:Vacuolar protein sorting-associated protein atg6 n=1 Tax=Vermiconidia calcicola TaxID=1690605 RepID=A0ACC3MYS8_9PEZI|nr:Vacuolar protein sorting-associated protein atg6 [Vermiconidia calcicola]
MAPLYCQKCRTQLKLDPSLEDLNPASFKILADAAPVLEPKAPDGPRSAAAKQRRQHYDEVSKDAGPAMQKRTISGTPRTGSKMAPDLSFIVLSESQIAPGGPEEIVQTPTKTKAAPKRAEPVVTDREEKLRHPVEMATRLFEILSARSDIDHPVCSECTELLLDGLQKRQSSVIRERDAYIDFLKKAQEDVPTDEERKKTKRDLEEVQRREKQALEELEALEAEKTKMEDEIAALDAEAEELDEEEERFWRERNAFTAELNAFQQERDSLQNQLAHDTKLLESLQRTNVYNDTFVIGHDGLFGTINGLRLGRLPDHPIEWAEINAAWGQVVLLLVVVAEKLGYNFKDYKLVPVGSTSKIVKYDTKQQPTGDSKPKGNILELFSSGNLSLGLGLFHGKFDDAMVAFLDCLRLVGEHVAHTSTAAGATGIKLPYLIHKDKIGEVSIRLGNFGPDEQWTKACKYTLTCCKFLLAHASHVDDAKNAR